MHTVLFENQEMEFYITFIDNPKDQMNYYDLLKKYLEVNKKSEWGNFDWRKDTLIVICKACSTPCGDKVEIYDYAYSTLKDEAELPDDLKKKAARFDSVENESRFYHYSLDKLVGDLEKNCDEIESIWREKLEPIKS